MQLIHSKEFPLLEEQHLVAAGPNIRAFHGQDSGNIYLHWFNNILIAHFWPEGRVTVVMSPGNTHPGDVGHEIEEWTSKPTESLQEKLEWSLYFMMDLVITLENDSETLQ